MFLWSRSSHQSSESHPDIGDKTHNVIVFGQSGAGKSSVVNMLQSDSKSVAKTSSGARGCTFKNESFPTRIGDSSYTIWDTAGLNEGEGGKIPAMQAVIQLYNLIVQLKDGVSLLVFVIRGPRLVDSVAYNWKLFHDVICQGKVPAVIVITGLEGDGLDRWLEVDKGRNKAAFEGYGIKPAGFACVTATRGFLGPDGKHVFDSLYKDSQSRIRALLCSECLKEPWRVPPVEWFSKIVERSLEIKTFGCLRAREVEVKKERDVMIQEVKEKLQSECGMSREQVGALARRISVRTSRGFSFSSFDL